MVGRGEWAVEGAEVSGLLRAQRWGTRLESHCSGI